MHVFLDCHIPEKQRGELFWLCNSRTLHSLLRSDTDALAQIWLFIGAHGHRSPDYWASCSWHQFLDLGLVLYLGCGQVKVGMNGRYRKVACLGNCKGCLPQWRVSNAEPQQLSNFKLARCESTVQKPGNSTTLNFLFFSLSHKASWWLSWYTTDTTEKNMKLSWRNIFQYYILNSVR